SRSDCLMSTPLTLATTASSADATNGTQAMKAATSSKVRLTFTERDPLFVPPDQRLSARDGLVWVVSPGAYIDPGMVPCQAANLRRPSLAISRPSIVRGGTSR